MSENESSYMSWFSRFFGAGRAKKLLSSVREDEHSMDTQAFATADVKEAMVQRNEALVLDVSTSKEEALKVMKASASIGRVAVPFCKGTIDQIVGYATLADLVDFVLSGAESFDWESRVHKIQFVAPSMQVSDLFVRMKRTGAHIAVVLDEYGGTDGIVYLDNILELLIGPTEKIIITDGKCEVNGQIDLKDLEEELDIDLTVEDMPEDIETLGGLILFMLGHVPIAGEIVRHKAGLIFEIKEASAKSITRVMVERVTAKVD